MSNTKEKLEDLLLTTLDFGLSGKELCMMQADFLVSNGVTVQGVTNETKEGWISIDESQPKCNEEVFVCIDGAFGRLVGIGWRDPMGFWKTNHGRTRRVSHWMPLPKVPNEERYISTNNS